MDITCTVNQSYDDVSGQLGNVGTLEGGCMRRALNLLPLMHSPVNNSASIGPLPASMGLFGAAMAGLAAFGRRRYLTRD